MGLYRYGFNGKENDNEVKGDGNQQDYGFRIYDPRVGRFLSVDPLVASYPMLSSYLYAANSPIINIDVEGLSAANFNDFSPLFDGDPVLKKAKNTRTPDPVRVQEGDKTLRRVFGFYRFVSGNSPAGLFTRLLLSSTPAGTGSERFKTGEIFTEDPSKLSDAYLQQVKERLQNGRPWGSDHNYIDELVARGMMPGKKEKRKLMADAFWRISGKSEEDLGSFFAAIDFSRPVTFEVLKEGDFVWRFNRKNSNGEDMHFFTDGYGADMGELYGAPAVGMGDESGYKLEKYVVTKSTEVLKSTIGKTQVKGVVQYFSTQLQNNIKKVED